MFHLLLPAALALVPALVHSAGGAGATTPRPDDPGAAVPETRYRAPQPYQPAERPPTTPDRHWIEANRTVLGYNPMMLTMPPRPRSQPPGDRKDVHPQTRQPAHDHAAHGHGGHEAKGHH